MRCSCYYESMLLMQARHEVHVFLCSTAASPRASSPPTLPSPHLQPGTWRATLASALDNRPSSPASSPGPRRQQHRGGHPVPARQAAPHVARVAQQGAAGVLRAVGRAGAGAGAGRLAVVVTRRTVGGTAGREVVEKGAVDAGVTLWVADM